MPIFGEKPFTSITVKINQLSTPNRNADLEDDSIELYMDNLLELIKIQPSGAVEAARAIRKKIKYGTPVSQQLLALNLLELLVLNGGPKVGPVVACDDKLVDLLKNVISGTARSGTGGPYDIKVVQRTRELAVGWRREFQDMTEYSGFGNLWKAIPRKNRLRATSSATGGFSEDVFVASPRIGSPRSREPNPYSRERSSSYSRSSGTPPPPRPKTASPYSQSNKKNKRGDKKKKKRKGVAYADEDYRIPQINYKVEAPKIRTTIADCYTHTTALNNALLALPEGADPLDNSKVAAEFEKCRKIRRSVLRYLQFVGAGDVCLKSQEVQELDEEFLGSLIVANEQLVATFKEFDSKCGYTDENPAPDYGNDSEDSDESYYSSDSSDEDLVSERLDEMHLAGTSSRLQEAVRSPPPRPAKPETLRAKDMPPISKTESEVSVESANPFGDSHEVSKTRSVYY